MKTLSFTDLFASNEDKAKDGYGLKIAKAISNEWFNGGMIQSGCQYATRRDWIRQRRLYALGHQDLKPYKDIIAREENDISYLNLDWRPVNILGKFNKIVADGIDEDAYDIGVKAVDNSSIESLREYEQELYARMDTMKMLEQAYQNFGIDLRPSGFVPEDEEELEMHMMMKPKTRIEIAEEQLIRHVLETNDYDNIKPMINRDLVQLGIGAAQVYTDKIEGIKFRYVDPEYFIHSVVDTPHFSDAYYYGEVVTKTIADLKKDGQFSDEELMDIAKSYAAANESYYRDWSGETLNQNVLDMKISILDFNYKTSKDLVYKETKRNKGTKYSKKDADYNPPKRNDYGKVTKTVSTWYEGKYIIGTEYIYGYQESENVAKDNMNKVLPNYICYAPELYKGLLTSFSSTIEPICDKMLYVDLKLQHLIAEIKPDGAEINMDKLYELAADSKSNEKEILSLFTVKGIALSKTVTDEGGMESRTRAVESINNGVPENLYSLVQIWEHYYNVVREITGVNPFRDGTQSEDSLVRVQQVGLKQSIVATKYITRGSIHISKKTSEVITSRIKTIFKYSTKLTKLYKDSIGIVNVETLAALKNRHIHSFGIVIEIRPTEEELIELNNNITIALQTGDIKIEDKIEIQNMGNFKKANQYLRYRSKKNRQQAQEDMQMQSELTTQSNIQAAQVAAEEVRNTKMFDMELEIQKEAQLSQIRIQEQIVMSKIQSAEQGSQLEYEAQLEQIKNLGRMDIERYKEDEKTKRQDRNNSQQSKMISQRNYDAPPIDFEGGEAQSQFGITLDDL